MPTLPRLPGEGRVADAVRAQTKSMQKRTPNGAPLSGTVPKTVCGTVCAPPAIVHGDELQRARAALCSEHEIRSVEPASPRVANMQRSEKLRSLRLGVALLCLWLWTGLKIKLEEPIISCSWDGLLCEGSDGNVAATAGGPT